MKDKKTGEESLFDWLPFEILCEIVNYLSTPRLLSLTALSKSCSTLFKPIADNRYLGHVVNSEYDMVSMLLKKNKSLIFKKGRVRDCSGRTFENISGFEYALWALDRHMWTTMLNCIARDNTILKELFSQYEQVAKKGITYTLNQKTITEKYFDFENTIFKELQTQIESQKAMKRISSTKNLTSEDWTLIDKQWKEGVGGAQKLLPRHVVHACCSKPIIFSMQFSYRSQPSQHFYNTTTSKFENWFHLNSKLGIDFGICMSYEYQRVEVKSTTGIRESSTAGLEATLGALKILHQSGKVEFIDLTRKLKEHMEINDHLTSPAPPIIGHLMRPVI